MKTIYKTLLIITLRFSNFLYKLISFFAIKYEEGLHPKHRLIGYHQFFLDNVSKNDSVLDIGCGNGALAYDLALKAKTVVGVDISEKNINKARAQHSRPNIEYVVGDVTAGPGTEKFNVLVLSNVLEHIEDRVGFLESIKGLATKYLIRVPMIDRDWVTLYKKEQGIEWRLDLTHYTEFTKKSFEQEVGEAGYKVQHISVQFGEIWAVLI